MRWIQNYSNHNWRWLFASSNSSVVPPGRDEQITFQRRLKYFQVPIMTLVARVTSKQLLIHWLYYVKCLYLFVVLQFIGDTECFICYIKVTCQFFQIINITKLLLTTKNFLPCWQDFLLHTFRIYYYYWEIYNAKYTFRTKTWNLLSLDYYFPHDNAHNNSFTVYLEKAVTIVHQNHPLGTLFLWYRYFFMRLFGVYKAIFSRKKTQVVCVCHSVPAPNELF